MIWFSAFLTPLLLAKMSSGAALQTVGPPSKSHTQQVQEVLQTINTLVRGEQDTNAGRPLANAGRPLANAGRPLANATDVQRRDYGRHGVDSSQWGDLGVAIGGRGARQAGEMLASLLGSGLEEIMYTIQPMLTEIIAPLMNLIGTTLLEWLSYTDLHTKAAPPATIKTPVSYDAYMVDFPEYGNFLVLGETRERVDDERREVEAGDVGARFDNGQRAAGMTARDLEDLDKRRAWLEYFEGAGRVNEWRERS